MEKEIIEVRNIEKKDEIEKMEKELLKKNLSFEEKEWERKEKLKQIEDKYVKLLDLCYEVRNDFLGDGGFFFGVFIGVLGILMMMGFLVFKLVSMFKLSQK